MKYLATSILEKMKLLIYERLEQVLRSCCLYTSPHTACHTLHQSTRPPTPSLLSNLLNQVFEPETISKQRQGHYETLSLQPVAFMEVRLHPQFSWVPMNIFCKSWKSTSHFVTLFIRKEGQDMCQEMVCLVYLRIFLWLLFSLIVWTHVFSRMINCTSSSRTMTACNGRVNNKTGSSSSLTSISSERVTIVLSPTMTVVNRA